MSASVGVYFDMAREETFCLIPVNMNTNVQLTSEPQ